MKETESPLLEPVSLPQHPVLRNRLVMASMTRNRCIDACKPGPAQVKHYADRARNGPGIIMSEGIFVDWTGSEWPHTPVMVSEEHAAAWREVVDAVHLEGGCIYFQAWHAGRVQHDQLPLFREKGRPVLAPSSIPAEGGKYRDIPGAPGHTTNITAIEDPREVIEIYQRAFILAKQAGFDGVELLFQGGYLPQQFLSSRANHRTDAYGESLENRCRFPLELVDAASDIFSGPEYLAIKISPTDVLNDSVISFEEIQETYTYLIRELVKKRVGIVTVCRRGTDLGVSYGDDLSKLTRPEAFPLPPGYDPVTDFGGLVKFPGSPTLLMANHGYTVQEGENLVRDGKIDLVMIGRPFICNPDLVDRVRRGIPLAENHRGSTVNYGPYRVPHDNYNDWPSAV